MNDASRWPLELGQEIADVYAACPGLAVAIATGSAARAIADAWSDLDAITAMLQGPAPATIAAFYAVIEERVSLVEQHMPAADTSMARAVLGFGVEPALRRPATAYRPASPNPQPRRPFGRLETCLKHNRNTTVIPPAYKRAGRCGMRLSMVTR